MAQNREPDIDTMELDEIYQVQTQTEKLKELVEYVYAESAFYKRKLRSAGLKPGDIKSIEDLALLPFTTREEVQEDNWAFLCVPKSKLVEIVETSGTTGQAIYIGLTARDVERQQQAQRSSFLCAGAAPEDIFHIAVTLDNMFIAGMAYYRGIQEVGATAVRVGPHSAIRHINVIQGLRPTGIVAVPSFMTMLARKATEMGFNLRDFGVKKAVLVGETIRNRDFTLNALGKRITEAWDIECFSLYGITEGALSFCECNQHEGLHEHSDLIITEIVADDGSSLLDGELGELVLTTLDVEGMPLLRYRTGDVTFKVSTKCRCGRGAARIGPVVGRKAQRLTLKGTVLYPGAIENALLSIDGVENYVVEAYPGDGAQDRVVVKIGSTSGKCDELSERAREAIKALARVTPSIEVCTPGEIDRVVHREKERKPVTFIDRRPALAP